MSLLVINVAPPFQHITPITFSSPIGFIQEGLYIILYYQYYFHNLQPKIEITTRYWSSTTTPPKNKVHLIESYLVSNHFLSYAADSLTDRQLRIHGGVISEDMFGLFINGVGAERTFVDGYQPTTLFQPGNSLAASASPSLVVVQDPRFEFDTQILDSRFGHILSN